MTKRRNLVITVQKKGGRERSLVDLPLLLMKKKDLPAVLNMSTKIRINLQRKKVKRKIRVKRKMIKSQKTSPQKKRRSENLTRRLKKLPRK